MDAPEAPRRRDALIQAGLTLASELSLPSVLQKITELACQVADARYGALGVLDEAGSGLEDFVTYGVTVEERRAIGSLPEGKGILGVLIEEDHSLRLERIQDHPRSVGFPANHPPMTTFLGVPVEVRGRVFGNLYLTEKRGGSAFTAEDQEAVETLAAQAGVAIENARIRARLEQLAVLQDRERIAQDLHDGVIQRLFAVGMSLQAAEAMAQDPEAVHERLLGAVEGIDEAIRELRNYIFGLRPGAHADHQLDRSLREIVDSFSAEDGPSIVADIDPAAAARLAGRETPVLQAAREALANAVRHAKAMTIRLALRLGNDEAVLEVEDDGVGFDPEKVRGEGQGLGNLEARATALGGSFEVREGSPGTLIRLRIPL